MAKYCGAPFCLKIWPSMGLLPIKFWLNFWIAKAKMWQIDEAIRQKMSSKAMPVYWRMMSKNTTLYYGIGKDRTFWRAWSNIIDLFLTDHQWNIEHKRVLLLCYCIFLTSFQILGFSDISRFIILAVFVSKTVSIAVPPHFSYRRFSFINISFRTSNPSSKQSFR